MLPRVMNTRLLVRPKHGGPEATCVRAARSAALQVVAGLWIVVCGQLTQQLDVSLRRVLYDVAPVHRKYGPKTNDAYGNVPQFGELLLKPPSEGADVGRQKRAVPCFVRLIAWTGAEVVGEGEPVQIGVDIVASRAGQRPWLWYTPGKREFRVWAARRMASSILRPLRGSSASPETNTVMSSSNAYCVTT